MTLPVRALAFGVFTLCLGLMGQGVVVELLGFSATNSFASHLVLVPFVSAAMVVNKRATVFAAPRTDAVVGLVVAMAGVMVLAIGSVAPPAASADRLALSTGGLLLLWTSGFCWLFGRDALRSARFPLVFLLFAVPIPVAVLDAVNRFLKWGSAETVGMLLGIVGTPVHREGFVFTFPTFAIEIADDCTGIRSSIALGLTALLTGYSVLARPWSRLVLWLLVLPAAVVKNGIRISSLAWLALNRDAAYLSGRLHHDGGVFFFLLSIVLLIPVVWLLVVTEQRGLSPGLLVGRPVPASPRS